MTAEEMTAADAGALRRAWENDLLATYSTPEVAFVRGEGTALFDASGEAYLDFLSGLAVTNLGHAHPAVAAAVERQVATLTHTSNFFMTPPVLRVAARLKQHLDWPDARAFFANSGAEANEAAIKLARRHGLAQHPDKYRLVALEGSFHGRTLATLEATGQTGKHAPFAPLAGYVDHVAHDHAGAVDAAVTDRTCAVILEVVQGEGGVREVPEDVLVTAREACDREDALLIVDEVQTGLGRTGSWFAFQQTPVVPDVVTLAKALGNGLPVGACVARGEVADAFQPGDHASTFGGNPVACAAATAVLDTIESDDLVALAQAAGRRLREGLRELCGEIAYAAGVRGRGLLVALELEAPVAGQVVQACLDRYLVVNRLADDLIRLAPPLTVTDEEIDLALAGLRASLKVVGRGGQAVTAEEETI